LETAIVNKITKKSIASQNYTFSYDIANRLISKAMPNGVNTTFNYDGMSRLKEIKDVKGTTTLFDRNYTYNTANQISQIAETAQSQIFL
jgi:YD repeat-containing protein